MSPRNAHFVIRDHRRKMNFFGCFVMLLIVFTVVNTDTNAMEKSGMKDRHMLAMGDESIMLARNSLRQEEKSG
ncbi:hypothetical protein DD238_004516 [Peronospora effusa]|uniref:Uncharacterized protein n=1 Tax=Peronospora effusa TaxID=542832 RepID=A0A3M6VV89_9STRA|nr:hypothetical protein DD238_004516 [Peronospora effusa]